MKSDRAAAVQDCRHSGGHSSALLGQGSVAKIAIKIYTLASILEIKFIISAFTTSPTVMSVYVSSSVAAGILAVTPFDMMVAKAGAKAHGLRMALIGWRRKMSMVAEQSPTSAVEEKDGKSSSVAAENVEKGDVMVSSYWGISKPKIIREDGTKWPWNCFMPWETYRADL
ncbi:ubiquinol oxidase mitochondrial [Phtheirospermum japonicum]|uniref:Ubiquinol oxidase mitochondrial n=1 Tax=Phtheirospermum japonicum TaxID=374723 RepID=A0A830D1R0_9LAMI|nr:ubiquinol oxidase mitochondrial [Phtheirospermum japonicum]